MQKILREVTDGSDSKRRQIRKTEDVSNDVVSRIDSKKERHTWASAYTCRAKKREITSQGIVGYITKQVAGITIVDNSYPIIGAASVSNIIKVVILSLRQ
jgi:hypothetical protein